MINHRKMLSLAGAVPLFLSACGELRSEEAEFAVAEENEPRPGAKTAEQQFLEQEQERLGQKPAERTTLPAPTPEVERVELVVPGQNVPGRKFTSVASCEMAKAALAKHDEDRCDPRAYCIPYERTCVKLD